MKKRYIVLLLFLFVINISNINAKTLWTDVSDFANNYIKTFLNYKKYLVYDNEYYGIDDNGNPIANDDFKTGGLINKKEFKISLDNSNGSFLFNGLEYFTMTKSNNNVVIIDPAQNNYFSEKRISEKSGVRVTNYVQRDVKLTGSGTINDPWKFIEKYKLTFDYDETVVNIIINTDTISTDGYVLVKINPIEGYAYSGNDCAGTFNSNTGYLHIYGNFMADTVCKIIVSPIQYVVTAYGNGGEIDELENWTYNSNNTQASRTINYGETLDTLPSVNKNGYSFEGWYDSLSFQNEIIEGYNVNNDITIYAKWTVIHNTVTLNQQSGSGGTSSVTATYGSLMPSATMPTRSGYTFGGYYTETNGNGTQYYTSDGESARNWDLTSDTELYAKWTTNCSGSDTYIASTGQCEYDATSSYGCPNGGTRSGSTCTYDGTVWRIYCRAYVGNSSSCPNDGYSYIGPNNKNCYTQWSDGRTTCPKSYLELNTDYGTNGYEYDCPNGGSLSGSKCRYSASTFYSCPRNNATLDEDKCRYTP